MSLTVSVTLPNSGGTRYRVILTHYGWPMIYTSPNLLTSPFVPAGVSGSVELACVRLIGSIGYCADRSAKVYRTDDGGMTWAQMTVTATTPGGLNRIGMLNTTTAWIVGGMKNGTGNGTILYTSNGGFNWTEQTSGVNVHLYGVSVVSSSTVFACGTATGGAGQILKTTNGGSSWGTQTSGTSNNLLGISMADANTGWCVGSGGTVRKTTNGGTNWTGQTASGMSDLWNVQAIDTSTAYIVGQTTGGYGAILKTTDGGTNWTALDHRCSFSVATDLFFADAMHGVVRAVGKGGCAAWTSDGGATWTAFTPFLQTSTWMDGCWCGIETGGPLPLNMEMEVG